MSQLDTAVDAAIGETENIEFDFRLDSQSRVVGVSGSNGVRFIIAVDGGATVYEFDEAQLVSWKVTDVVKRRSLLKRLLGKTPEVQKVELIFESQEISVWLGSDTVDELLVVMNELVGGQHDDTEVGEE